MTNKKTIDQLDLAHKKVLIRVDFNVPIADGKITSEKRIDAALATIQKAIDSNAKVILFSHLGRIKSEADKQKNSLEIVSSCLAKKLNRPVIFITQTRGNQLESAINSMKDKEVILVENTRFQDFQDNQLTKFESKNNEDLGRYWASLGDVFINDAFGTAHRAHASNVGIATYIKESALGYLMMNELQMLSQGLDQPQSPFVAIVGGAKVSDKIKVIDNLLPKADKILIGGGMAYTFLKVQGYQVGNSLLENDFLDLAKQYLAKANGKIVLPVDNAIANQFADQPRQVTNDQNIPDGFLGLDIGPKTISLYEKTLQGAKTVVWNGPMGVAEFENFKQGTEAIAQAIANQKNVFSIIGGGDSAAAAIKLGFEKKFTHISTGGGASLAYMEGKELPAVSAIDNA